jgi:hypothetical protein
MSQYGRILDLSLANNTVQLEAHSEHGNLTMPAGPGLQRYEGDFAFLSGLPGGTFNRKRNPFQHTPGYINDNPYQPDKPLMIRYACCMYYKRECGVNCYYCPILKAEERAKLKAQIEVER